jgi:hypothetical protein
VVVEDRGKSGDTEKERVKLRGDTYWMNKMCVCWTPIRGTTEREREREIQSKVGSTA